MAFSEAQKIQMKQKAAYRCCVCQKLPVEIHHIVPQANGGTDDEENGVALCPNCHTRYGGNPEWRKKLKEYRNWWYKVASIKYPTPEGLSLEYVNQAFLSRSSAGIKEELMRYIYSLIDTINTSRLPNLTETLLNGLQLDTGILTPVENLIAEGPCSCERKSCVGHNERIYCYFTKDLSLWVLKKKLYWQCYDEVIQCPRCALRHPRGHVGRAGDCGYPYLDQHNQKD